MHSAHTQKPGCAHTARAVPRSWALLRTQPTGREHVTRTTSSGRAQVALIAPRPWAHVATSFLIHPQAGYDIVPRSRPPGRLSQVATSIPCHDLPSAQPKQSRSRPQNRCRDITQPNPGRDLKTGLRHRFSCLAPSQVATPKPGRDPPRD